jgi:hypothetical protein
MARAVEYAVEHEAWNVYHLSDGTTLKTRIVLSGVTFTGFGPDGKPNYILDHQILTHVQPAEAVTSESGKS